MIEILINLHKYNYRGLNIVFEGDSLTYSGTFDNHLCDNIKREYISTVVGTNGANIDTVVSRKNDVINLFDNTKDNILVLWIGTNDASAGESFSISDFIGKLQTYYNDLHNYFTIILIGLTDLPESRNYGAQIINNYHRYHHSDYSNHWIDIFQMDECKDHTNTTYFTDGVHHTDALDLLISNYVYNKLSSIIK